MRKIFMFIMLLALVLGSVTTALAADTAPADVLGTVYEDAVNVLMNVNVVSGYEDGLYRPENIVTRAEMAVLIVNGLGLQEFVTDGVTSSFSDMDGYGWAQGYVGYAQGLGVVSGYEDGTFGPGRTVSYDEAATMLVAGLGHTPESLTGTWPANYVSMARALGILDGITASSEGANRGDIAIMLYQTLDAQIGTVNADGVWESSYDTMLARLGAREANGGEPFVVTDSIAREESLINMQDHIGAYLKAYVNKEDEIIAVIEVKSTFMKGKLKSGKFSSSGTDYAVTNTVYENGKDDQGAISFYNGEQVGTTTTLPSSNATIAAETSGSNLKTVYSVTNWSMDDGEHGFFTAKDAQEIESSQTLFGYDFPEDHFGDIDYKAFSLLGVETLSDIKEDDVVYVYLNSDEVITRVTVGRDIVEGTVSKISDDDALDADYTIENKKYGFANSNALYSSVDIPDTGDAVKAYLNYDGDMYKVEVTDGSVGSYAIVLTIDDTMKLDGTSFDNRIKLFLADGTDDTYKISDDVKVRVNGTEEKEDLEDILTSKLSPGDIIEYGLDKNGRVNKIYITETGQLKASNIKSGSMSKKGAFNGYFTANNVAVFTLDGSLFSTGSSRASDYGAGKLSNLLDADIDKAIYITNDDHKIVAMLVNEDASADDEVYGIALSANKNTSDAGYEIQFLVDGGRKTYNVTESVFDSYENSYLYELIFNSDGDVIRLDEVTPDFEITDVTSADLAVNNYNLTIGNTDNVTDNNYLKGNNQATLHMDMVVYKRDSGKYASGKLSDIVKGTNKIQFFSLSDDGVIDCVLVDNKSSGGRPGSDD